MRLEATPARLGESLFHTAGQHAEIHQSGHPFMGKSLIPPSGPMKFFILIALTEAMAVMVLHWLHHNKEPGIGGWALWMLTPVFALFFFAAKARTKVRRRFLLPVVLGELSTAVIGYGDVLLTHRFSAPGLLVMFVPFVQAVLTFLLIPIFLLSKTRSPAKFNDGLSLS